MTTLGDDAIEEVRALLDEYKQFLSRKAEGTTMPLCARCVT